MSGRLDVVLVGPPGAGKGTQAVQLCQREGRAHLSTGDLLRQAIAGGTPLGLRVKPVVESGRLADDESVLGLVEERLGGPGDRAVLLDGFPRTVRQAEMLAELFASRGLAPPVVIEIRVPTEALLARLTSRRTCASCGPRPAGEFHCSGCGMKLAVRADDDESVIRERLRVYEAQTAPLVAWYGDAGLLLPVDGEGSPDAVAARIASVIAEARARRDVPG